MKKILATILVGGTAALAAQAQTMYDALRYSQNNYYGTAKSIALGNAMTALGGDLGSIGINPAGSAVNAYSQFTITPNVSLSTTGTTYYADDQSAGERMNDSWSRLTMPNLGMTFHFKTGNTYGLKGITFGFLGNATANYLGRMSAAGINNTTTWCGSLAADANGIPSSSLLEYGDYANALVIGNKTGLISTFGQYDDAWAGVTERIADNEDIYLAGPIEQRYGRQTTGYKYDMVLNLGFNLSDVFYFGFNLGLVSLDYNADSYFKEIAVDPDDFPIDWSDGTHTYFDSMRFRSHYDASGSGVYGKFGFIYRPAGGLRIGAAIQTPTSTTITERWQDAGDLYLDEGTNSESSPEWEYEYRFISPYRVNAGVAYTFGTVGLVSADYEMADYSTMKFREIGTNDHSAYDGVNADIYDFTGVAHQVRLGAEVKPAPEIALRAGYNWTSSPERYYDTAHIRRTVKAFTHAVSFGLGYSSGKSFFADLACRGTFLPEEYDYPYTEYIDNYAAPVTYVHNHLWDIVATLGWRF